MKKFSIRTSRLLAGAAVAAAALFAACTADTEDVPVRVPLRFAVSMPEGWDDPDAARSATDKALPTRAESIADIGSFGVFAYVESPTGEHALYLNNVKVKRQTDGTYAPDENYYLRGGMKTIFFAYSPYDVNRTPEITCNVFDYDKTVLENWLTAVTSVEGGSTANITLKFSHALSYVTFKVTGNPGTFEKATITLSDVATKGTLAPDITNSKWKWTPSTESSFADKPLAYYLMIPQTFSETPTATLKSTDNKSKSTSITYDDLTEWKENQSYTYEFKF